jgi:hypothetical protein
MINCKELDLHAENGGDCITHPFDDVWDLSKSDLLSYVLLHGNQCSFIDSWHYNE